MPGTFDGRLAFASILFTAPGAPAFRTQSGDFASVAVVGGVTRLTFQDPIAPYQGFPSLTLRSATGGYASVVDWTSTYLDIETLDTTGAAAEIEFDLTIVQQTVSFVVPPAPPPPPAGPSLVGLRSWWRADDIAVADGAPVVTWNEHTGNGNDLTVPAGANSPTFRAADPNFNGLPVVEFVPTQALAKANPVGFASGASALTAYLVIRVPSIPNDTAAFFWGGFNAQVAIDFTLRGLAQIPAWGTVSFVSDYYSTLFTPNTTCVLAVRCAAGATWDNSSFEVNNVFVASSAPVFAGPAQVSNPVQTVALSINPNGALIYQLNARIAEVLYYDTDQTPAERAATYSYLQAKYGIP